MTTEYNAMLSIKPILPITYSFRLAVFVMGFSSIAWQIIIIRELLVVFRGVELTIGIIFGNWLLLEALGCSYTRKKAETTTRAASHFTTLQLAMGVCSVIGVIFLRSFKYLFDIPMGQLLGYHYVLLISFLVLAPVTLIKGAMFPLACKNMDEMTKSDYPSSKVYIIEAVGAFTAGFVFVFYLIYRLDHIFLVGLILLFNFITVFVYTYSLGKFPLKRLIVIFCIIAIGVTFFASLPETIHKRSSELLWYESTLLDNRNSEYSNIVALEAEGQYTFFVNGIPFASVPEPFFLIEEKAHFPMLFHPNPQHTLVIGGGIGGMIKEISKHRIDEVHYAEQDPLIVDFFQRYTTPLTEHELTHPAVRIHHAEGIRYLRTTKNTFDVIIVNLPAPSTLQINRYFTKEFFQLVQSRLNQDGIFSVSLPGSETFLTIELIELNRLLYASMMEVFQDVRIIIGEENVFIASNKKSITDVIPDTLVQRLYEREIYAGLINEAYILYKMDPVRFQEFEDIITRTNDWEINTNMHPRGVFRSMQLHALTVAPAIADVLYGIDNISISVYTAIIVVLVTSLIVIQKKKRGSIFIGNAIATTGFASMLMYILLILYFQIFYGYVYHYIGLLTALFMGGTAAGAFLASRKKHISLLTIEISIVALISLFLVISLLDAIPPAVIQVLIFSGITVMGLLTGMAYPVAVRLLSRNNTTISIQPGKLYALDLFGAFIGAIITAVILIPSLGIQATLLLVVLIKIGSAALVYTGKNQA